MRKFKCPVCGDTCGRWMSCSGPGDSVTHEWTLMVLVPEPQKKVATVKYKVETTIDVELTDAEVDNLIREGARRKLLKEDLAPGDYKVTVRCEDRRLRTRLTIVTPKEVA